MKEALAKRSGMGEPKRACHYMMEQILALDLGPAESIHLVEGSERDQFHSASCAPTFLQAVEGEPPQQEEPSKRPTVVGPCGPVTVGGPRWLGWLQKGCGSEDRYLQDQATTADNVVGVEVGFDRKQNREQRRMGLAQ